MSSLHFTLIITQVPGSRVNHYVYFMYLSALKFDAHSHCSVYQNLVENLLRHISGALTLKVSDFVDLVKDPRLSSSKFPGGADDSVALAIAHEFKEMVHTV